MTRWTANDLPDLTGKTVVITGATAGIGLITANELEAHGALVVRAVRNVSKATGDARHLDISDLESVRRFADEWTGDIDILINNAGVMDVPFKRTADGLELTTATNYVGPVLLTNLLLPHVTDRVVHVSSELHRQAKLRLDDLNWESRPYRGLQAYNDTKLELALYSLELQKRMSQGLRSIIAHPGVATTTLVAHSSMNAMMRLKFLLNTPEKGALPTLFAATQDLPGNSYVGPDGFLHFRGYPTVHPSSKAARDEQSAQKLWEATERLLAGVTA